MRTAKTLIRLGGCQGWSESSLGAHAILIVLSWGGSNEPSHEIMTLFVLRKLILQTRMRSHPVRLDLWFLVGPFVNFHTLRERKAKALARLRGCAGSPEPSLVAFVINTIISWAGSNYNKRSIKSTSTDIKFVTSLSAAARQNQQNDVRPAKTQISLGIRPVWSESSLSAWRSLTCRSLAILRAHSDDWSDWADTDQTGRMPKLIRVFIRCTSFCWFCRAAAPILILILWLDTGWTQFDCCFHIGICALKGCLSPIWTLERYNVLLRLFVLLGVVSSTITWVDSHANPVSNSSLLVKQNALKQVTILNNWAKWSTSWQNQQNGMCAQRKTQISLGIRPVWSESSLSAWRKLGSLATHMPFC